MGRTISTKSAPWPAGWKPTELRIISWRSIRPRGWPIRHVRCVPTRRPRTTRAKAAPTTRRISCARRPESGPLENYFACVAGAHYLKRLFEVAIGKAMRDDRPNIQSSFQHDSHLVPGLVHFAAVDAFDAEHVENDGGPIDGDLLRRNA